MSEFRVNTISDAAGTGPTTLTKQSAAKAWAEWTNIGTAGFRGSFNFSSYTDTGVGAATAAFTNAFTGIRIAIGGAGFRSGIGFAFATGYGLTTSTVALSTATDGGAFIDISNASVNINGDLA